MKMNGKSEYDFRSTIAKFLPAWNKRMVIVTSSNRVKLRSHKNLYRGECDATPSLCLKEYDASVCGPAGLISYMNFWFILTDLMEFVYAAQLNRNTDHRKINLIFYYPFFTKQKLYKMKTETYIMFSVRTILSD